MSSVCGVVHSMISSRRLNVYHSPRRSFILLWVVCFSVSFGQHSRTVYGNVIFHCVCARLFCMYGAPYTGIVCECRCTCEANRVWTLVSVSVFSFMCSSLQSYIHFLIMLMCRSWDRERRRHHRRCRRRRCRCCFNSFFFLFSTRNRSVALKKNKVQNGDRARVEQQQNHLRL